MAKKSTNQEKALPSSQQLAKAKKNAKPAKDTKPATTVKAVKSDKSSKATKTRGTASVPATAALAADIAVNASSSEKPSQFSRKKQAASAAAPTVRMAADVAISSHAVAVLEKPQPAPEPVVTVALAETGETPAPRSEIVYSDEANALYVLGIRYSTGRDVEQDLIAAHKWFNLAAMMGHEDAKSCRADVASEMNKAQIAEAQRQARDWMRARDTKHSRDAEAQAHERIKRPTYVRRRAQAIRSANSFARTCACA